MRSLLPALMLGSIVIFVSGGGYARAASRVPSPTPTRESNPSSILPAVHAAGVSRIVRGFPVAGELLQRMRAAVVKKGSVHVDFQMVSALYPAGEVATHLSGDVSWKLNLLHDRTIVQRTNSGRISSTPLESIDLRLVHQRAASHTRVGSWQCQNLQHVHVMSTLLGLEETILSAVVVGSALVHATPVWEVHATAYSPATGTGVVAQVLYEISQQDSTLQRVVVTGTSSFGRRTQQIVASEQYSHYGEFVNVHLPAACMLR